jgi:hypothetical protein
MCWAVCHWCSAKCVETSTPPCPICLEIVMELLLIPAGGISKGRGNWSRLYELNLWMWCYGRGQPRKVIVAEAEQRLREQMSEQRQRAAETMKRRRAERGEPGRMEVESEDEYMSMLYTMWYTMLYSMVYIMTKHGIYHTWYAIYHMYIMVYHMVYIHVIYHLYWCLSLTLPTTHSLSQSHRQAGCQCLSSCRVINNLFHHSHSCNTWSSG